MPAEPTSQPPHGLPPPAPRKDQGDEPLPGYAYRVQPYAHQRQALRLGARKWAFAFFMEQGTGKTKVILDNACFLYSKGVIDGLLVLAPNEVDEQWLVAASEHVPHGVPLRMACWSVDRASMVRKAQELAAKPLPGRLALLAMNHDSISTKRGMACARQFLRTYSSMLCLDESHAYMTPEAARTKAVLSLAPLAKVRRICTGTPESTGPFNLYSQFQFLHPDILRCDSYVVFKKRHGIFEKRMSGQTRINKRTGQEERITFDHLVMYRNVDKLYAQIDPYTYRVRKDDCLDLPPKVYVKVPVSLSPAQAKLYASVKDTGVALLRAYEEGKPVQALDFVDSDNDHESLFDAMQDQGNRVSMTIKLVTMLRCQQVVGGHLTDDAGRVRVVDGDITKTPRFRALLEHCAAGGDKIMVWAVFTHELAAIHAALSKIGETVGIYGAIKKADRNHAKEAFAKGSARFFVGHTRACGTGLDFPMTTAMHYYSCSPSYVQRAQSEDRGHRIGQKNKLTIYDYNAHEVGVDAWVADILAKRTTGAAAMMGFKASNMREVL